MNEIAETLGFGKKCGTCKHWQKANHNVLNLKDVRGECRHSPPTATTHVVNDRPMVFSSYPLLPIEFPACGQYEAKEEAQ